MSAIAGIVQLHDTAISLEHGGILMNALRKYAADDAQTWHSERAFLGCHAQWITPEQVGEQLPYYDSERQLAVTADAIIDNREELFEQLGIEPERRKTMPDSRLILLAYAKWGEESVQHLVGDFAFVLWDDRQKKLFGARDFTGTRTLYYCKEEGQFAFCTVMEPLLQLPYVSSAINEEWLAQFLAIPFTTDAVDVDLTVYRGLMQVPPSHSFTVQGGELRFRRYCTLTEQQPLLLSSNEEYEEALREVFGKAVAARVRTHRSVGAHLSGGLDSGSVASFAVKELKKQGKQLTTFSYVPIDGFEDWTHKTRLPNEKPSIQSTVRYVGHINDHYLDFEGRSSYSDIDDWLDALEMPYKFFENSYWLKGIYETAESQDIGILLNGQRGNWTVSWGHALDYQAKLLKQLKLGKLYQEVDRYSRLMGVTKARVLKFIMRKAFPELLIKNNPDYFPKIINPEFAAKTDVLNKVQQYHINITGKPESVYDVKRTQFEQLYYWNINGLIGTKLSLRHKVWERDPTNDLRVVRFCLSVPEEQFVQNGYDRSLIRRATKGYLPDDIRLNQRKRGIQGADGIQRMLPDWGRFIEEVESIVSGSSISDYVNIAEVKSALEHMPKEPTNDMVFAMDFRLLMRSVILHRFIQRVS